MNVNHPHDIIDGSAYSRLDAKKRKDYVPIPPTMRERLEAMTPEERGAWLRANPIGALRLERAEGKRRRKGR